MLLLTVLILSSVLVTAFQLRAASRHYRALRALARARYGVRLPSDGACFVGEKPDLAALGRRGGVGIGEQHDALEVARDQAAVGCSALAVEDGVDCAEHSFARLAKRWPALVNDDDEIGDGRGGFFERVLHGLKRANPVRRWRVKRAEAALVADVMGDDAS